MPEAFTFGDLAEECEQRGHSPARIVEHLRAYEHFDMIEHLEGGQIRKTGGKPYF